MDGNRYYWRAWANDGSQDGDPSSTWFDVDLSAVPDETPDDPADGSTDAPTDIDPGEFVPTPSDDLGCGCETVPGSAGGWPALLVLVAVVGLAARFRGVRGGTR